MIDVQPYPLHWPAGVPRTPATARKLAKFATKRGVERYHGTRSLTIAEALRRLDEEVRLYTPVGRSWRIKPNQVVVSTNLRVRKGDGMPASGQREPDDPGVAIYFELDGEQRCIPCDKWNRVADNIAGVAAALGALRGLERWVNDSHVRAAFQGFLALPASAAPSWRQVLQLQEVDGVTPGLVDTAYRRLAQELHPDRGGSEVQMAALNQARVDARRELGVG